MRILAIDPGPEQSAFVVYDGSKPVRFDKVSNVDMLQQVLPLEPADVLVIEQVAAMGMAVGAEVFETVFWSGRFAERWQRQFHRVKRHQVKMHLCGNTRAKDANIRAALIDRFGPGKDKAIGTKKQPGPLYKISGDCWQSLALAVTWWDTNIKHKSAV